MSNKKKFLYYRTWVERRNKSKLNAEDIVEKYDLFRGNNSDVIIERKSNYYHEFEQEAKNLFYGRIIKAQDDREYFRTVKSGETKRLSEFLEEDGETGQIDYDITNIAILIDEEMMYVLLESGFQTPGVGVLRDFIETVLNKHLPEPLKKDIRVESKWMSDEENEEKLEKLLDEEVKKTELRFKKKPELPKGASPETGVNTMLSEDYALRVEWSVRNKKNAERKRLKGVLKSTLGVDEENVMDTMKQINFPRLLSTFEVELFDDAEIDDKKENLARVVKMEEIEVEGKGFGSFDKVGRKLAEVLKNEIKHTKTDEE